MLCDSWPCSFHAYTNFISHAVTTHIYNNASKLICHLWYELLWYDIEVVMV